MRVCRPVQSSRCCKRPGLSGGSRPARSSVASTWRSAGRPAAASAAGPRSRAREAASALSAEGPICKLLATIPSALFTTRTRKAPLGSPAAASDGSTCPESSCRAPSTSSAQAGKPGSSAGSAVLSSPWSAASASTVSTPPTASATAIKQSSSPSQVRLPTTPFSKREASARKAEPCWRQRIAHLAEPASAHHQTVAWFTGAPPAAS
mmetsp:Transcript_108384/g.317104  ORF Transcript_108384/g.317104 Transcript_108384/m.317104 type:complete len:207 (+) Transcript_108384:73-693(+)